MGNDLTFAAWQRVSKRLPPELQSYAREWGEALERLELDPTEAAAKLEWELWRCLCTELAGACVVTADDLKASRRDVSTPGRQLLVDLRTWGQARAAIAKAGAV